MEPKHQRQAESQESPSILASLESLEKQLREHTQLLRAQLQEILSHPIPVQGAQAHEVTRKIQELADQIGSAIACPKPGCGIPSRMRYVPPNSDTHQGIFAFAHNVHGRRTTHGTSFLPPLTLVDPAIDRRKKAHPEPTEEGAS